MKDFQGCLIWFHGIIKKEIIKGPKVKVFWTEMTSFSRFIYILRQLIHFLFLWLVPIWSFVCRMNPKSYLHTVSHNLKSFEDNGHRRRTVTETMRPRKSWISKAMSFLERHSAVPLNKFLYWEFSKYIFYSILTISLVSEGKVKAISEHLALFWTASYVIETSRSVKRFLNTSSDWKEGFRRWCHPVNIFTLVTNVFLIVAFFLSTKASEAYLEAGRTMWSLACLMAFLRAIKTGLMWRQTGPIIISMSYMFYDIITFLFFFVAIHLAFTLCTVFLYDIYADLYPESIFVNHKSAFKYFFWAVIRAGNPQFANLQRPGFSYDLHCLNQTLKHAGQITDEVLDACKRYILKYKAGEDEMLTVSVGTVLWACYQFFMVIMMLSILRARMINTYQRIKSEADIQWKFFRASIWWKYLDASDVSLPPPYTIVDTIEQLIGYVLWKIRKLKHKDPYSKNPNEVLVSPIGFANRIEQRKYELKMEFYTRYQGLVFVLLNEIKNEMEKDDSDHEEKKKKI